MQKHFTLEDANHALVFVKPIVLDIQEIWLRLVDAKKTLESLVASGRSLTEPDLQKMEVEIDKNFKKIERFMKELEQVGCLFKDFSRGLVDFPTFYKNTEVYLCWHVDEEAISCWHQHDSGFDGRKDVDEDFIIWNSKEPNVEFSLV